MRCVHTGTKCTQAVHACGSDSAPAPAPAHVPCARACASYARHCCFPSRLQASPQGADQQPHESLLPVLHFYRRTLVRPTPNVTDEVERLRRCHACMPCKRPSTRCLCFSTDRPLQSTPWRKSTCLRRMRGCGRGRNASSTCGGSAGQPFRAEAVPATDQTLLVRLERLFCGDVAAGISRQVVLCCSCKSACCSCKSACCFCPQMHLVLHQQ